MQIEVAAEIAEMFNNNHKIDAIKAFRFETKMGLMEAKLWLEEHQPTLLSSLQSEFCTNTRDLIAQLKEQRRQLDLRIDRLIEELAYEEVVHEDDDVFDKVEV